MSQYVVFDSCLRKKHKASICSKATLFYIITSLLSLIIPLVICFKSHGFWKKYDSYREKPEVYFKHQMIFNAETNIAHKPIMWTTFNTYNNNIQKYYRPIIIEHLEEDIDRDGKNDILKINITVPVKSNEEIYSCQLLLFFQYRLYHHSRFEMESIVLAQHSANRPGSKFTLKGDLRIYQKEPLTHNAANFKYNTTVVLGREESLNINNILHNYFIRNVTTHLTNTYPLWTTPRAINQPFKVELIINYPEETFLYKLGFWQLIKWAWIQYFSILIIFLYLSYCAKDFVFTNQVLRTIVESPLKRGL